MKRNPAPVEGYEPVHGEPYTFARREQTPDGEHSSNVENMLGNFRSINDPDKRRKELTDLLDALNREDLI